MEHKRIIQVDEKVPFNLLLPLSIQHMFAMFGATILVPILVNTYFNGEGLSGNRSLDERLRNADLYDGDKRKSTGIFGI